MHAFIGRTAEIHELRSLQRAPIANLVILQGRRRIGKSRLVEEFARGQRFLQFTGIPPGKDVNAQAQRNEFVRQLALQTGLPELHSDDWAKLFQLLARESAHGRVVVLMDEISWMAWDDPTFLGKLKTAWDLYFSKNRKLMLILCGSVSSWIEKNIVSSTAFLGRPSRDIRLDELSLTECNQFWGAGGSRISSYEKLKVLAVTGGVPRYLELVDPALSAENNIRRLFFAKNSPLLNEFENIFSDTFGARSAIYRKIIASLIKGPAGLTDILKEAERAKTGDYSEYLNDLATAGFLARDYTWQLKTGEISKLSRYRLKDNFVRFHLRYVRPNRPKIVKGQFENHSLAMLPGWEGILALQFENLVLNNDHGVARKLGIALEDIVFSNPYFQRRTQRQTGCQIDLAFQTRLNTVYACEIKFSKSPVRSSIVAETEKKLACLSLPKGFSMRPVLIHVNGVERDVIDSRYFAAIVDFGELLEA